LVVAQRERRSTRAEGILKNKNSSGVGATEQVPWAVVEVTLRLLAAELGPHGIRTVCLHSAGSEGAADKTLAHTNPELDERTEGWGNAG
jgi:hypothetical protein